MPVVISHSFNCYCFLEKYLQKKAELNFWAFSIFLRNSPDIDVLMQYTGLPYGHMLGHRGFFHSIIFVLIIAFIIVIAGFHEIKRLSKECGLCRPISSLLDYHILFLMQ